MTQKLGYLYLKCKICDDTHLYTCSKHEVVALETEWKNNDENTSFLSEKPELHKEYNVLLKASVKIDLDNNFWSIYMHPNAQSNGIESEDDIQSIRLCLCKPIEIMYVNAATALVRIKVVKYVDLNHDLKLNDPKIEWLDVLDAQSKSRSYYRVTNFSQYTLIDINFESDLGLTLIVYKEKSRSKIVAFNEWDFHKNLWYLCAKELTKPQEKQYGIQH